MNPFKSLIPWLCAVGLLAGPFLWNTTAQEIPYPSALDAAAIRQARIADLNREALTIGNGDLNALLWERHGALCLRGGTDQDRLAAKEWIALFWHDAVLET